MRPYFLAVFALMLGLTYVRPSSAGPAPGIKSYREWKTDRVTESQGRLEQLRLRLEARKGDPNLPKPQGQGTEGRDPETSRLEGQIRQEIAALETARELTVSDYFAGYLTKMADKRSAFKEAAGKLSPEEVAELMAAYANSVFGVSPTSGPGLGPDASR